MYHPLNISDPQQLSKDSKFNIMDIEHIIQGWGGGVLYRLNGVGLSY